MATRSGPGSLPAPGTRLAHYEVEAELGRGGMGVVYRARDLALHRPVALKSPLDLDPESVRRFLSEARAASQLSSPYIVGVHEVFEANGRPWMVMEFVQGESLRARLKRQGAPHLEDGLRWALHLAEALQIAHQQKLLHRDINPKNVLVDDQGRARLTDFGLAKSYVEDDEITGDTTRLSLTRSGAVLGTRGYMSPEQILGRALDPRTDIFSLGATLYELFSGRPAFRRSQSGDALDAILYRDPLPLADIPPELDRILRKMLAKKPEERYPSAADLRADLRALRRKLEFESYGHEIVTMVSKASRRWRMGTVVAVAAAFSVAALALRPWQWSTRPDFDSVPTRSVAVVTWPYVEHGSRISPDEQWVSFVSDRGGDESLWVRQVSGGTPRRVETNDGMVLGHAWSPDGREMAVLLSMNDALRIDFMSAPLGSWPRRRVTTDVSRIVDWIGNQLFLERADDGTLWAMDPATGEVTCAASADATFDFRRDFAVREDGRRIAFAGVRDGVEDLWVAPLDGSNPRVVTSGDAVVHSPQWMGPSRLVYVSNRGQQQGLWTVDLEGGAGEHVPFGQPFPFLEDTSSGRWATVQSVYEEAHLWRSHQGAAPQRLTGESLGDFHSSYCASTGQVAFTRSLPGRRVGASFLDTSIELADVTELGLERVRTVVNEGIAPLLSPDGRRLAYLGRSKTPPYFNELHVKDLETQGNRLVSDSFQFAGSFSDPPDIRGANVCWSPDGSRLYYVLEGSNFVPSIVSAAAPRFEDLTTLFEGEARTMILDLHVSGDGKVTFVMYRTETGAWQVVEIGPRGGQKTLHEVARPRASLAVVSDRESDTFLILEADWNADYTQRVSVHPATREESSGPPLTLARCHASTAHWDAPWLYLTIVEDGIHDVVRIDPGSGEIEELTTNDLPGVTFSGIQPLSGQDVAFSRQVVNADIWLLEFSNPTER